MINRWIEDDGLLDTLEEVGAGCIAFSPLAQGLLTNRYLDGIPPDSRVATGGAMGRDMLTDERLAMVARAQRRRRPPRPDARPAGARLGAARPADDVAGDRRQQRRPTRGQRRRPSTSLDLTDDELAEIDRLATADADINLWARSSTS